MSSAKKTDSGAISTEVVIETLRSQYSVQRVAYVDIDVHHGDYVFYAYERHPQNAN